MKILQKHTLLLCATCLGLSIGNLNAQTRLAPPGNPLVLW